MSIFYRHTRRRGRCAPALIALTCLGARAQADVVISTDQTQNMTCSAGVCQPTATDAVLNVSDLVGLLAAGSVTVTTTGSGVEASNIDLNTALSWSNTGALTLQANQNMTISAAISVEGASGLTLSYGQYGLYSYGPSGDITFVNLSSGLNIEGVSYTLVGTLKGLASAIAANPSGNFALAKSYDASQDGAYSSAPVPTTLNGLFDGLNNTISNLTINDSTPGDTVGLFEMVGASGSVGQVSLRNVNITTSGQGITAGALVGVNYAGSNNYNGGVGACFVSGKINARNTPKKSGGQVIGGTVGLNNGVIVACHSSVEIRADREDGYGYFGGLVGENNYIIALNWASGNVSVGNQAYAGGLVGANGIIGLVEENYAIGDVKGGNGAIAGGLFGENAGLASDNYATGSVSVRGTGKNPSDAGGLIGDNGGDAEIATSYSTGKVSGAAGSYLGGSMGLNYSYYTGEIYWDTTTSGTGTGVGNGYQGATGLTTRQFKSGLPAGFDSNTWGEKNGINRGFPYLLQLPPK